MTALRFGDPRLTDRNCCGKPHDASHQGCLFLRHPWKRANVFADPAVSCQATAIVDGESVQCVLLNGHDGPCLL